MCIVQAKSVVRHDKQNNLYVVHRQIVNLRMFCTTWRFKIGLKDNTSIYSISKTTLLSSLAHEKEFCLVWWDFLSESFIWQHVSMWHRAVQYGIATMKNIPKVSSVGPWNLGDVRVQIRHISVRLSGSGCSEIRHWHFSVNDCGAPLGTVHLGI